MSQEQPQRPVTYGDVFPATQLQGEALAAQPVTMEDASLMQSAEAMTFGKTQKGGAASAMQAAASTNVDQGLVDREAHSVLAELGMTVAQTALPGAVMDVSYVAGNPVSAFAHPTPTDPTIAAMDAVTIGEALEAAAVGSGDKPIDENDARAILSAEARATGISAPVRGGVGSVAQSAAELNQRVVNATDKTTLADVLMDATVALPADKVVTAEDAEKVLQAEMRHKSHSEGLTEGGVGAAMAAAAELNERIGMIAPAGTGNQLMQSTPEASTDELEEVIEVGKYYPMESSFQGASNVKPSPGTEGATPAATQPSAEQLTTPLLPDESNKSSEQQPADPSVSSYHEQLAGLHVPESTPATPLPHEHVE